MYSENEYFNYRNGSLRELCPDDNWGYRSSQN